MTLDTIIRNATIINENQIFKADVSIKNSRIEEISKQGISHSAKLEIDAEDLYLMPGVIDDQVHFREPGLTHKAEIATESRAAVAGGVTSFMEMPNTVPQSLTQELLEKKYQKAAEVSPANYSFFMGVSNDNLEEVLKTDPRKVCGLKIFMGSSTGDMLVDNETTLRNVFSKTDLLIATHCEDEDTIRANTQKAISQYGDNIPFSEHPIIRSREACYKSSHLASSLAKEYNTRLHILHISTQDELKLFRNDIPLSEKRITAEVCVHHLTFNAADYEKMGREIKCNPAIKNEEDRRALWDALNNDILDIIATDHAPHTWEEKSNPYLKCPSGIPLIQHTLLLMLEHHKNGLLSLEKLVEKMCHAPALCFQIKERGFIKEGYYADLVLVCPNKSYTVNQENILHKCKWSPFENKTFSHSIEKTFVNGHLAYDQGKISNNKGLRLAFDRN